MKLTIDIGNTCAKLAVFDGKDIIDSIIVEHDQPFRIAPFCQRHDIDGGIWSTVKDLTADFCDSITSLPFPMLQLVPGVTAVPVEVCYSTPLTLGPDRLAAIVGAWSLHRGHDIMVIDIGTCITYDLVTSSGQYLGGNISPGPKMRFRALNTFTSRLPLLTRQGDTPTVGYDTATAIRSGVIHGIRHEIEGYISEIKSKYPNLLVYLTGGVDIDLHNSEKMCTFADKFLVHRGLNTILLHNEEQNKE
ncbi:hypothetical protein CIK99_05835 [Prevotella sp. P5-92]|uniref:type III pantothenate kinase n=1 Tax=Prevotella sp. P5-92 TaxID=2024222 RepID=UPI000B97C854|nr:type III pantothenate kinase [Prevotella sp. P5-92]OYP57744.1 hypothetical protein CIK99_05835 [Prevotella sp. P5-92]